MVSVLTDLTPTHALIIFAVAFQLFGLLTRNELWLRVLLLTGSGLFVIYYLTAGDQPLWEAVFASALLSMANIYTLTFIVLDRSTLWMKPEMRDLFAHFPTFNPGQFRRIMRHATSQTTVHDMVVCRQGAVPEGLYLLLEGQAILERNARRSELPAGCFIGEMSFLRGSEHHANATVTLKAGSRYIVWDRASLTRQISRHLQLHNALIALFNRELLIKLDQSWPENQSAM